jgi:Tn7-like transposition protein D
MAWATKAGLTISRRPKKMTTEIRKRAISELEQGHDKIMVANNANVSEVTITKLLLTEVGLQSVWRRSRSLQTQTIARQKWLNAVQQHTNLGIKYVRALDPAIYAWLYRNDRAWLDEHKPERLENSTQPGARRLLWDERDKKLSVAIELAVLDIQTVSRFRKIKLWQLFQAVPDLKSKLNSLDQLPLTRLAIDQALRRCDGLAEPDLFL